MTRFTALSDPPEEGSRHGCPGGGCSAQGDQQAGGSASSVTPQFDEEIHLKRHDMGAIVLLMLQPPR